MPEQTDVVVLRQTQGRGRSGVELGDAKGGGGALGRNFGAPQVHRCVLISCGHASLLRHRQRQA